MIPRFLPAEKPTGHRMVRFVVVGGGVTTFEAMTLKVDLRSRSTQSSWFFSPDLPPIFSLGWDP